MFKDNKKILNTIAIAASLALPITAAPINQSPVFADDTTNQNTNSNRTVSVQKLYADVYDQESGRFLGRYLLDVENGYSDSPHRMFNYTQLPQIQGYGYITDAPMVSIDWTNPSGVADMKVYAVRKSSALYQKVHGDSSQGQNNTNHTNQHQSGRTTGVNSNNRQAQNSKKSSHNNSLKKDQSQTSSSSSTNSKQSSKNKLKKSKNSDANKVKTPNKADKNKNRQKSSNLPTIIISIVALIIAAIAIIWGFMRMRKPRRLHKHQRR